MNNNLLFLSLITFLISGFPYTASLADSNCSGNDIALNSLTINTISSGSISYNYEIENTGDVVLFFNKMVIQNYLSEDNTYNSGDSPAGGSLLTYTGKSEIVPGEKYTGTFNANFSTDLENHSFLIVTVIYNEIECNLTNN